MKERFETSLRIAVPSMTVNKRDIGELCKVVSEATKDSRSHFRKFLVVGGKESVQTESIEKLVNSKWPQIVDAVDLVAYGDNTFIRATLEAAGIGANRIEISGIDPDWVTLRLKEVEDFLAGHRNWHWILHNVTTVFLLSALVASLIGLASALTFHLIFMNTLIVGISSFGALAMVYRGLMIIYPYTLVETGRSSLYSTTRKFLNWLIPTLLAAIILEIVLQAIF
jgi:hypothetical protein